MTFDRNNPPVKMRRLFLSICLCSFLGVSVNLHARPEEKISFTHLSLEDGLSQNSIVAIIQDKTGFMWFATYDGLNRYDGYRFMVYKHDSDDRNSISDSLINCLYEDQAGQIWVGTGVGLNRFDPVTERFLRYKNEAGNPNSLGNDSVRYLYGDHQGVLWVGTDYGLNRYDPATKSFTRFLNQSGNPNSLSHNTVVSIHEDHQGMLWIGTNYGLNRYDPATKSFTRFLNQSGNPNSLNHNSVTSIYEDHQQVLWIGTVDGLSQYDRMTHAFVRYQHDPQDDGSLSHNEVNRIFEDSKKNLWIGTDGGGLNRFDRVKKNFIHHKKKPNDPNSLSGNRIFSIFEDRTGALWIGTWSTGLNRFDTFKRKFELYQNEPNDPTSLSNNGVYAIYEDHRGVFWVGTTDGLNYRDQASYGFSTLRHDPQNPNSLTSNRVWSINEDAHNQVLWIGTSRGLNRYDRRRNTFTRYQHDPEDPSSLSNDRIFCLLFDSQGELWIGTEGGGLNRYDQATERFFHYRYDPNIPSSLCSDRVYSLYEDRSGTVFIGTSNGLNQYDRQTDQFICYQNDPDDPHSLNKNTILSLCEDHTGALWIGTDGDGVNRFDRSKKKFTHITEKDGLPKNWIYAIFEDDRENLWMSTNNGLFKYNLKTKKFKNYDASDGLQSNEFNLAAYKNKAGKMFFGGIKGFNAFYPDDIEDNPHVPPVVITSFQLFNKPVPIGKEINDHIILEKSITYTKHMELSYRDYVFSFEFAGLHYTSPEKNEYVYMLEGLEKEWNHVRDRRFVTYTNLSPGEYTFRVKASNDDGVWNEEGLALAIVVIPPFWETWWFQNSAGLIFVLMIFTGYRIRVRNIRARNILLENVVQERTSELKKKKEELEATQKELVEKAHKEGMAEIATDVLHNVGNLLNSVNTSALVIRKTVESSRLDRLTKANDVLRENIEDFEELAANRSKIEKLVQYYYGLEKAFQQERSSIRENTVRLVDKINSIGDVIVAQQRYAKRQFFAEKLSLAEIVEDVLTLQYGSIIRHDINIDKKLNKIPRVLVQKSKLVHILVNLYKNAKESMADVQPEKRKLAIEIDRDDRSAYIRVADTGHGVQKENLKRIFSHGFTTKKEGHGFGLHSCANYMTEMGGKIWVESQGEGEGAMFGLSFPLDNKGDSSNTPEKL